MKITRLDQVEKKELVSDEVQGVTKQLPIGKADGAPNFSMRVFSVEPGGYTPYHSHPWEHENYVLAGRGVIRTESGEERQIQAGDFAMILPGEMHQFRNTSESVLKFICMVPREQE